MSAFGIADAPTPLAGGQGTTWRAGDVVLKPENDEARVGWLVANVEAVADTADFRLARHRAAADGRLLVGGWEATGWLEGAHGSGNWDQVLATSRAFHAALASVPVPATGIPGNDNQWRIGDRVAWNEQPLPAETPEVAGAIVERLRPQIEEAWTGPPPQVIHADIGNNILFAGDGGLPPAVIDMSPYARPAAFADAVTVADAMAWQGASLAVAIRFATTVENGAQLLARAVVFRLVAASEAWRGFPERVAAEVDAYRPVLSAI